MVLALRAGAHVWVHRIALHRRSSVQPAASAAHVVAPTTPSGGRPFAFWKFMTAVCVAAPKFPSAVPVSYPSAVSRCWSAITSAPLAPSFSVGRPATGNVVVVGGVGFLVPAPP